jgi:hypothetical protein
VLGPGEVLRESVNAVQKIMGYSHVAVMWLKGDRLVPTVWIGYANVPEVPLDCGVTGRAARTRQADQQRGGPEGSAPRNAMRFEETGEQAICDGLTDLYNHAYFQRRIRE